jgi:hypothetical protein
MSPDRNRSEAPAQKRRKFKKLLEDVDAADSKVLRLFPSMDFEGTGIGAQVKKGLQTALRVLLVAAEDGYVNENELSKYGVGGDSRHRVLHRLCDLGLLVRSEEVSLKGGTKFVHRLSGKGVVLCAAFPRIFKSRGLFISLIESCVADKSLAHTMLTLYFEQLDPQKNRLLESLHGISNAAINIEHVSEEALAENLLHAQEMLSTSPEEVLLFKMAEQFIDWIASAPSEDIAELRQSASSFIEVARSDPTIAKRLLVVSGEGLRLLRSPDFGLWIRIPGNVRHLKELLSHLIRQHIEDITSEEGLAKLWRDRKTIIDQIRRRFREESYSYIMKMRPKLSEALE